MVDEGLGVYNGGLGFNNAAVSGAVGVGDSSHYEFGSARYEDMCKKKKRRERRATSGLGVVEVKIQFCKEFKMILESRPGRGALQVLGRRHPSGISSRQEQSAPPLINDNQQPITGSRFRHGPST